MPEKSGVGAAFCEPIFAGAAVGTTCCAEAGITAAAIVTSKRYCRALMSTSPSWFAQLRALVAVRPGGAHVKYLRSGCLVRSHLPPARRAICQRDPFSP